MHWEGNILRCSPSDLTVFLDGDFPSWMDRWYADQRAAVSKDLTDKKAKLPEAFSSPHTVVRECCPDARDGERELIARKGDEHEAGFLNQLKAGGLEVVEIPDDEKAAEATMAAMKGASAIIYQGCLQVDDWRGFTDFLAKQNGASKLGDHHYEVWDTKLARSPKPYFLVQLCSYADLLEVIQGVRPKEIEVILGDGSRKRFLTNKFFYYYRELKRAFVKYHKNFNSNEAPHPGDSPNVGRWSRYAEQLFEASDDLACVARMTRLQARKLRERGISTMAALADCKEKSIQGLSSEIYERSRIQAKLQVASRGKERPLFVIAKPSEIDPRRGLALLPPPSPADVFFDMEGYPLTTGGLEYLFGAVYADNKGLNFIDWWAHNAIEEKAAFEQFVDWAFAKWKAQPSMHIYHYAAYEVQTMRRLMGKYATREHELDELLRNEVFIDLYTVVRQGLIVGTVSYSLKQVEKLYLPKREGTVTTAGGSVVEYQRWLDERDGDTWETSTILRGIRDYNRIDCESTHALYGWLLERQKESGIAFMPKPVKEAKAKKKGEAEKSERAEIALKNSLLNEVAAGNVQDLERKRVQELLAWLLEFHWREEKPAHWRMFDRHEMTEDELIADLDCLGAMNRTAAARVPIIKSWGYEFTFDPDQDTKLHEGSDCYFAHDLASKCEITAFDGEKGIAQIKLGPKAAEPPQRLSLIPNEVVSAKSIAQAIYRYVEAWAKGNVISRSVDDLLFRRPPRVTGHAGGALINGSPTVEAVVDIASRLDASTLCIQGPPGTGKTFTAAAIITKLLSMGKSVGITSNSHKAILNAMHEVVKTADSGKVKVSLVKVGETYEDELVKARRIKAVESDEAAQEVRAGVLIGGTAWVFSRPEFTGRLDYLVVDEAGQVSLANVVATAQSATNLILVGDQMQLAQPIQGSHPGESGQSALEYLLKGNATVPPEFGVFLDTSYRMHPHICQFISDAVYDGRLKSHPDNQKQELQCETKDTGEFRRTCGVAFIEVPHQYNSQCSEEEIDAIEKLVKQLIGRCVVGRDGTKRALSLEDVLFVAPYNMQVRRLKERFGPIARVGSVDRFQGQQAPVVIVSMCVSAAEDVPRGIEFILNKNRLNVAVSRAQCLAIVVGCRGLMAARCTTIENMEMANLYCWLADHAEKPFA